jgi:lambda family phage portal protein
MALFSSFVKKAAAALFPRASAPIKRVKHAARTITNYGNELWSWLGYAQHGASLDSLPLDSWFAFPASPRDDIDKNQVALRARSRDLYMSNGFAGAILNAKRDGVIGRGLELDAKVDADALGLGLDEATAAERRIEAEFARWARNVGANGECFNDLLQLAYFAMILDGDVVADVYCIPNDRILRVRLIESDCLITPPSRMGDPRVLCGIELARTGRPMAYWLATGYEFNSDGFPVEFYRRRRFMSGFNSLSDGSWIFPSSGALFAHTPYERPGQLRGLPVLSRVMRDVKQLGRYIESELDAAVVASKPALFRTHPAVEAQAAVDMMDSFGRVSEAAEPTVSETAEPPEHEKPINYGNGLMIDLWDGADMRAWNPSRPNQAYSEFVDHKFSEIASNVGLSAEVVLKRFTQSYSASRASLLDAQRSFEIDRARFVDQFVRPIYNAWLDLHADELGLTGYYTDPRRRSAWRCAEWIGEQLPNIDPTKEIDAAAKRVQLCVSTLAREAQQATGTDIAANIRQRGYEEKLMREYGLVKDQNGNPINVMEGSDAYRE